MPEGSITGKRRFWLWVLPLAFLAIFLALFFSPLFRVQRIKVVGAQSLSPDEVAALVGMEGHTIILLPLKEADARLRLLPMVRDVTIRLQWPNTLLVRVEEREPWGYWVNGGQSYVIDEEGVVLEGKVPSLGAPSIIDTSPPLTFRPGDRVDSDAVVIAHVVLGWAPVNVGAKVVAIKYNVAQGLSLTTDQGLQVVIGDSKGLDFKLEVWRSLAEELGNKGLAGKVLDLRFGARPALRYHEGKQ